MSLKTSRQKVLSYLYKSQAASAREISRGLKMSEANVRHHLRVLVADGRLEMTDARHHPGRGRPEKVYSIPRAALGDNLSVLSEALLTEAGPVVTVDRLAKHLAGERDFASHPMAKRLSLAVEKLNSMNYHARWEAGAEGPRILFSHCPYAAVLAHHPELCEMDVRLLSHLIARPISQATKSETQRVGVCPLVFLIR